MAKKGQVFRKYSPEFKLSVILDMRETRVSSTTPSGIASQVNTTLIYHAFFNAS